MEEEERFFMQSTCNLSCGKIIVNDNTVKHNTTLHARTHSQTLKHTHAHTHQHTLGVSGDNNDNLTKPATVRACHLIPCALWNKHTEKKLALMGEKGDHQPGSQPTNWMADLLSACLPDYLANTKHQTTSNEPKHQTRKYNLSKSLRVSFEKI